MKKRLGCKTWPFLFVVVSSTTPLFTEEFLLVKDK